MILYFAFYTGNGRPFIMEVSGTYVLPSNICMREIMESVRSKDPNSLNKEGDIDLLMLKKVKKIIVNFWRHNVVVVVVVVVVVFFLCL